MKIFGTNVFGDAVMRERLPKNIYKAVRDTIDNSLPLDQGVADVVASAMKDWATDKGATHYTHWFQPLTGLTAEKHDSFISPTSDGKVIMEFSGKDLIKGEPDASSFPSGGLRATFEARGYTAWDCTSPAFLREEGNNTVLCIPTAFCSYTGEALDNKTPVLRSMEALSKQAVRVLRLFGDNETTRVTSTVGPEQEYFLVDKKFYEKRMDLILTGRTLFGAMPPKGQEMEDQYFGSINERISNFMRELNIEAWKLGISAKTQHKEVAPGQYEIAPVFNLTNISVDHNQLVMDLLKKVANRHGLVCLLHEKPFAGVNGSGKHNNWALGTNTGRNLLDPGSTPHENVQFLTFLCAVIKAVDEHADLLRASAANTGNDHRLGANEAPPAIISIFLGDQLSDILKQLQNGGATHSISESKLSIRVSTIPPLKKDSTDRNRTSPFAFTGNKFEFRMVPSSQSVALPNVVLNTIVAEALSNIANRLEQAEDIDLELKKVLKEIAVNHAQVCFDGNNYSEEWVEEAARRGLPNISATVDAISAWTTEKAVTLFEKHSVLNSAELHCRYEIYLEQYSKTINIEAQTMLYMVNREILPAGLKYVNSLATGIQTIKGISSGVPVTVQESLLNKVSSLLVFVNFNVEELTAKIENVQGINEANKQAEYYRDEVFTTMNILRKYVDELEKVMPEEYWPLPTYADMLFKL